MSFFLDSVKPNEGYDLRFIACFNHMLSRLVDNDKLHPSLLLDLGVKRIPLTNSVKMNVLLSGIAEALYNEKSGEEFEDFIANLITSFSCTLIVDYKEALDHVAYITEWIDVYNMDRSENEIKDKFNIYSISDMLFLIIDHEHKLIIIYDNNSSFIYSFQNDTVNHNTIYGLPYVRAHLLKASMDASDNIIKYYDTSVYYIDSYK